MRMAARAWLPMHNKPGRHAAARRQGSRDRGRPENDARHCFAAKASCVAGGCSPAVGHAILVAFQTQHTLLSHVVGVMGQGKGAVHGLLLHANRHMR